MRQYTTMGCAAAAAPCNRRQLFSASSEAHLRAVVSQLLSAEGVPPADGAVWGPIVAEAAQQVAAYLSPAMMYAGGSPDPRQVVKVGLTGGGPGAGWVSRLGKPWAQRPRGLLCTFCAGKQCMDGGG